MREIARAGSFERDLKKLAKKHQGIEDAILAPWEPCSDMVRADATLLTITVAIG